MVYVITGEEGPKKTYNSFTDLADSIKTSVIDDGVSDCRDEKRISKGETIAMVKEKLDSAPLNSEVNHVYKKILKGVENN